MRGPLGASQDVAGRCGTLRDVAGRCGDNADVAGAPHHFLSGLVAQRVPSMFTETRAGTGQAFGGLEPDSAGGIFERCEAVDTTREPLRTWPGRRGLSPDVSIRTSLGTPLVTAPQKGGRMPRFRLRAAIAAALVALGSTLAGGIMATTQSSDEAAIAPARPPADRGIESRVNDLVSRMTLQEKLEQIQLLSDGQVTDADARGVGGRVQPHRPGRSTTCSTSRSSSPGCGIPMIFAFDIIHGYRTIFPIPLAAASSFDPIRRLRRRAVRRPGRRPRSASTRPTRR